MKSKFLSIEDVWDYLNTIPMFSNVGNKASNFGLENIATFCERIGNPQKNFKSIHIAGTNGKGTTCYLLEAVYKQAGFKTGLFTSPHLLRYNERIRISGKEITDVKLLNFFQETERFLEEIPLTYFEISTALAFWTFSRENVDLAIIEAGLGGRLDSTNIIDPELSIITSIGKDHEAILGNTLEKIAFEKAGIIKFQKPTVVGNLDKNSFKVIQDQALLRSSEIIKSSDLQPEFSKGIISLNKGEVLVNTSFVEPVNAWNVAISLQVTRKLKSKFLVDDSSFKTAVESFKGVPARFEKLHPTKNWYFSGSHNEQAVDAMLEGVEQISVQQKVLVLSLMKDKVTPQILAKLKPFDSIYFYEQEGERAATIQDIEPFLPVLKMDETNAKMILNELHTELVIFAGSFYFYSTIKRWITN